MTPTRLDQPPRIGAMKDPREREQARRNLRLALLLGGIALAFFVAIVVKQWAIG